MSAITTATSTTSTASLTNALFSKLDTKQKGYIDAADLKSAAGTDDADGSQSAQLLKQLDSDGDGKITKSELSTAIDKVGAELNAQLDQSRTANATANATTNATTDATTDVKSGAAPAQKAGGGGGAPAAASGASDSTTATTTKYVAAADTNDDGTVSADEEAAYKLLLASQEAKAQAQVQQYKNISGASESTDVSSSNSVDVTA